MARAKEIKISESEARRDFNLVPFGEAKLYINTVSKKRTTIRNFWTTRLNFTDRVDGLQPNQFVYLFSSLRSIRTKNQATVIVSKSLTNPSLLHY